MKLGIEFENLDLILFKEALEFQQSNDESMAGDAHEHLINCLKLALAVGGDHG